MKDLQDLGREVAAAQDRQIAALGAAEDARARFLGGALGGTASASSTPRRLWWRAAWGQAPRRRLLSLSALAAAAIAGLAVLFVLWSRGHALTFSVGGEPFASNVGQRITSPADRPVPVRFSDGSVMDLSAGTSLRITALGTSGAIAELEQGRTNVRVVHGSGTHWALWAGPYAVEIVGTRFDLAWNPATARLGVRLLEGRVLVSGGSLASPVYVEAGQVLAASESTWKLMPASELAASDAPAPSSEEAKATGGAAPKGGGGGSQVPEDPDSPAAPALAALEATPTSSQPSQADAPASPGPQATPGPQGQAIPGAALPGTDAVTRWQELAQRGKYDDALGRAEHDGFETVCRGASAADLMTLSEVARFAKRPARSRQALLALRERFPGDPQAPMAAFLLGRLSGGGDAARWFRAYLREAPEGALQREASGRLLEALSRSGDTAAAQEAARSYLKQYPHGPHAPFAERILSP